MLYFASLKKSLHLFPLGRGQFQPCFKKYFAVCKNLLTYSHWEKPNAHPKSQKIFYPFTYLELRSRNAPCFYKNFEKIFFQSRALILLAQKAPSLIPTGNSQMHPLNPKKFLKRLFILKSPHPFPLGKGVWGRQFWKKAKKFARREWRAGI